MKKQKYTKKEAPTEIPEPGQNKIDNRLSIVIGGKGYGEIDWTNVELIWDTKREMEKSGLK